MALLPRYIRRPAMEGPAFASLLMFSSELDFARRGDVGPSGLSLGCAAGTVSERENMRSRGYASGGPLEGEGVDVSVEGSMTRLLSSAIDGGILVRPCPPISPSCLNHGGMSHKTSNKRVHSLKVDDSIQFLIREFNCPVP